MTSNNYWLFTELKAKFPGIVGDQFDPYISVTQNQDSLKIYSPASEEYIISAEVVEHVASIGANTISYPSWSVGPTDAALEVAKSNGIKIMKLGALLGMLTRRSTKK